MKRRITRNVSSRLAHALLCLPLCLAGCHSAFVQATVTNETSRPIHLFEVDYPSASFGSEELAGGATYHYRFKIVGDGQLKLTWTDASEKEHTSAGPALHEGQEGQLAVSIGENSAVWKTTVHP